MNKKCTTCNFKKTIDQFYKYKNDKISYTCNACKKIIDHDYYLNNKKQIQKRTTKWNKDNKSKRKNICKTYYRKNPENVFKNNLRYHFNITIDDYNKMLINQNYLCKICENPDPKRKLSVDHCHKTGKIRGLLCHPCNIGIGHLKDNIKNLQRAIQYLENSMEKVL